MEHLLIIFAYHALVALDRRFQKGLRSAVPRLEELWDDPEGLLAWHEVVIKPRRAYAMASVLGGLLGLLLFCGIGLYSVEFPHPRMGPAPLPIRILLLAALPGGPLVGILLFWHWLRGGEMILRADGVLFRYRSDRVFCPWALFQGPGEAWKYSADRWGVPPWPPGVPGVVHSRRDRVVATGYNVRTRQLDFREDGLILRDLYCARLGELAALLLALGKRLGPLRSLDPLPARGDAVPDRKS